MHSTDSGLPGAQIVVEIKEEGREPVVGARAYDKCRNLVARCWQLVRWAQQYTGERTRPVDPDALKTVMDSEICTPNGYNLPYISSVEKGRNILKDSAKIDPYHAWKGSLLIKVDECGIHYAFVCREDAVFIGRTAPTACTVLQYILSMAGVQRIWPAEDCEKHKAEIITACADPEMPAFISDAINAWADVMNDVEVKNMIDEIENKYSSGKLIMAW